MKVFFFLIFLLTFLLLNLLQLSLTGPGWVFVLLLWWRLRASLKTSSKLQPNNGASFLRAAVSSSWSDPAGTSPDGLNLLWASARIGNERGWDLAGQVRPRLDRVSLGHSGILQCNGILRGLMKAITLVASLRNISFIPLRCYRTPYGKSKPLSGFTIIYMPWLVGGWSKSIYIVLKPEYLGLDWLLLRRYNVLLLIVNIAILE